MGTSLTESRVLMFKIQAAERTVESSLTSTNIIAVGKDFKHELDIEHTKLERTRGLLGQDGVVRGLGKGVLEFTVPVIPSATPASVPPNVNDVLKCGGHTQTKDTNAWVYTPNLTGTGYKDCTVQSSSGDKTSGDCMLFKSYNHILALELSAEAGKPFYLKASGEGCIAEVPAAGTHPLSATALDEFEVPPCFLGGTVTIDALTVQLQKFMLKTGLKAVLDKDPEAAYGYAGNTVTLVNNEFTFTFLDKDFSANSPFAYLAAASKIASINILSNTIDITGSDFVLSKAPTVSSADGIDQFELTGYFLDNDYVITINHA
jgi:hypothetical protein